MYWAALRPEESLNLLATEYERPKRKGGWGRLHLTGALSEAGAGWTDSGDSIEERRLKHRPDNAVREVPAAPPLCALLDHHIEQWPPGTDGPDLRQPARAGRDLRRPERATGYPQRHQHGLP